MGRLSAAVSSPPVLRPGPCLRRGCSKARTPVARTPCLLATVGEGCCLMQVRSASAPAAMRARRARCRRADRPCVRRAR
ncbi:hypothetical protein C7T79_03360 [Xanthomonas oryzae pv. oryzicola]|nr:hypothetical protein C7T79_03360 [Xanthomonas oryzae pv. oryzicola]